jgi:subtilisin family serine protease
MVIGGSGEKKPNPQANDPSRYRMEYTPGEILVQFTPSTEVSISRGGTRIETGSSTLNQLIGYFEIAGCSGVFKDEQVKPRRERSQLADIYKLKVADTATLFNFIELLNNNPSVVYAEPNYIYKTCETYPDDPLYQNGSQWYIDAVNAPAAWDSVTSDSNQVIAILDTGVDWDHPDLDDAIWTNWDEIPGNGADDDGNGYADDSRGWDWINNDNDPHDDNSHGTHVAGIAAAENNNGTGIAGVAWGARIMPLKVLQSSGRGSAGDIAAGINYARNNGATVINIT